jgi:hypothetical protein
MDAAAVAAGLADYETRDRAFPFEAVANLSVLDAEGREVPLPSLWGITSPATSSPSPSPSPSPSTKTILVFGRNLL